MSLITVDFNSLERKTFRTEILPWLAKNCSGKFSFNWPYSVITFEDSEDAAAAILAFGGTKIKSKIDLMIENES